MFDQDDLNDSYREDVIMMIRTAIFIVKVIFIIAVISIFI